VGKVSTNIVALYFIQAANYGLPLITLPYLIRVLGIDKFGLLSFSAALTQYFVVFTDYGFNLSATREVSINRNNIKRLGEIVSSVFVLKGLFLLISAVVFSAIVAVVAEYRHHWTIYAASFLLVIGNVVFPGWLFQGLERMPLVTFANVSAKFVCAMSIFLFVKSPADIATAAAIQSAGNVIGGAIGFVLIKSLLTKIKLRLPSRQLLSEMLHGGKHVFASQISALLVNGSQTLILGIVQGPLAVGHYSVAEKVIKAANNAQVPVCNAIYPRVATLFSRSNEEALAFLRRVLRRFLPLMAVGSMGLFVLADWVVYLLSGTHNPEVATLLRVLALLPVSVFLDNILGTQILLNIGRRAEFMWAIVISGIASVACAFAAVPKFGALASASVYLGSQLLVLLLMGFFVRRAGISLMGKPS
jgi:PST family polysaccharide transporter